MNYEVRILKRITQTKIGSWIGFIKKIRSHFGDSRLRFTFSPFKGEISRYLSTFGPDNIDKLEIWLVMMNTKFFSMDIDTIVVVVRIFLPDKVDVEDTELLESLLNSGQMSKRMIRQLETEGKITIPRKDIYHFAFKKDEIVLFDERETYESQITDVYTGNMLRHEPGLVYRSSIELYDYIMCDRSSCSNGTMT